MLKLANMNEEVFPLKETAVSTPTIKIEYENMGGKDSLFKVDGTALGQALSEIGYPDSVLKPPVITNEQVAGPGMASYDLTKKAIVLNQRRVVNNMRQIYRGLLEQMGEEVPKTPTEEKDILQRFINTKVFRTLFPAFWPYRMLKDRHVKVFSVNPERRRSYLQAAKEGTLMPGKPIEEQRERARKFMGKLLKIAMGRPTAWILAHEYEHLHDVGKKTAVKFGLTLAPVIAGGFILDALTEYMQQMNISSERITDTMILGILGIGATSVYGMARGRAMEEQASYDAGYKNFRKVMDCFTINHAVFAKEVLGEV